MILTAYVAGKQRRPQGPYGKIEPEWQDLVRERLDEKRWKQKDLAEAVGASAGAISGLLKPGATQSRLVSEVCRVLEIPPPEYKDEREQELVELLRKIREKSPDEFDKLDARARRVERDLKKRKDSD